MDVYYAPSILPDGINEFRFKTFSPIFFRVLLVVRDFSHSLIWRRINPGWSSDGGQSLMTFFTFVDILIASSRVTGMVLPVSRRRFVTTELEDIYHWPNMSAGEISLSKRIT